MSEPHIPPRPECGQQTRLTSERALSLCDAISNLRFVWNDAIALAVDETPQPTNLMDVCRTPTWKGIPKLQAELLKANDFQRKSLRLVVDRFTKDLFAVDDLLNFESQALHIHAAQPNCVSFESAVYLSYAHAVLKLGCELFNKLFVIQCGLPASCMPHNTGLDAEELAKHWPKVASVFKAFDPNTDLLMTMLESEQIKVEELVTKAVSSSDRDDNNPGLMQLTFGLKGKQKRGLEFIIQHGCRCTLKDLACYQEWQPPFDDAWSSFQNEINGKIRDKYVENRSYYVHRHDCCAVLEEKPSKPIEKNQAQSSSVKKKMRPPKKT